MMSETETTPPASPPPAPDDALSGEIVATTEAILFTSDKPLPPAKVAEVGELGGVRIVRRAVGALNERYEQMGCSFRVVEVAGGYQMQTLPEYADVLSRLVKSRSEGRLTQAALETLAIVAYRQPVLRADVEAIRGVACGEVLRGLLERNLVRIAGRAEEIGRPILYGTTRHFLEAFGLAGLDDLPNVEQLRPPPQQPQPPQAGSPAPQSGAEDADEAATGEVEGASPAEEKPEAQAAETPEAESDE